MYNHLKIRPLNKKDLDEVSSIEHKAYGNFGWSKKLFMSELANPYSRFLISEDKNTSNVIGYIAGWLVSDECHITTLVVSPLYRRKHIADILLYNIINSALSNRIKWLTLEVRISNIAAIGLYTKYNFKQLGIRKKYYQDNNEDALILWSNDISSLNYGTFLKNQFLLIKDKFDNADILQYDAWQK